MKTKIRTVQVKIEEITAASGSTLTPNVDTTDLLALTALAANLTIANHTGTPQDGQIILIRLKDNATPRTITFGTDYVAFGQALPTTTTASKTMYIECVWNASTSKFDTIWWQEQ